MPRLRVLPLLSAAGLLFAGWYVFTRPKVEPAPPAVAPPRAPYESTLAGSGVLEPAAARTTAVGAPFAGLVLEVFPEVGDRVEKGAPLFRLDDRLLTARAPELEAKAGTARAQVRAAEARLESSRAQVSTSEAARDAAKARLDRLLGMPRPESLPPLTAKLTAAQAAHRDLTTQVERLEATMGRNAGITSQDDLDRRRWQARVAEAQVMQAQADLELAKAGAWAPEVAEARAALRQAEGTIVQATAAVAERQADVSTAQASVSEADAAVAENRVQVERAVVRAPVAATVLDVTTRAGEYATADRDALVLLGDLSTLLVRADVDEESVPLVRANAKAQAVVRGFPDQPFELEFVRIEPWVRPKRSLTGATNERVDTRVLQVIFKAKPSTLPIYVGQQVDVFMEGAVRSRAAPTPATAPTPSPTEPAMSGPR